MREIEFRAKNEYGKWFYGSLVNFDEKSGYVYILEPFTQASTLPIYALIKENLHLIDIDTIGQYTGLKDKNGVKIFEGDIMPIWENGEKYLYKVVYDGDCFMLSMLDSEQGSYPLSVKCKQSEVIGNIYENKELLCEQN